MAISHQAIREVVEAFNRGELVLQIATPEIIQDRYLYEGVNLHIRSRVVDGQPKVELKAT